MWLSTIVNYTTPFGTIPTEMFQAIADVLVGALTLFAVVICVKWGIGMYRGTLGSNWGTGGWNGDMRDSDTGDWLEHD